MVRMLANYETLNPYLSYSVDIFFFLLNGLRLEVLVLELIFNSFINKE